MRHIFGCFLRYLTSALAVSALLMQANAAKPSLKGADLLCNGESFFAASNICSELTRLARADGVLPASESFKQVAVSGVPISTVLTQFKNANPKPKYVVTDGGGIDLMSNTCTTGDTNCAVVQSLKKTMKDYIAEMAKSGVKSFLWMGYPDPQGNYGGALKTGQDIWAIVAKRVMDTTTAPKALWVDLRTTWAGHYSQYTSDGIHCTDAGGTATAQAFWNAMKANDYAFFDTTAALSTQHEKLGANPAVQLAIQSLVARNGNVAVSLSIEQPSNIALQLTTVSGRSVFMAKKQTSLSGLQTVVFPSGALARGIYYCEVKVGKLSSQSTLLVQ
jgi:hypothetical protein